MLELEIVFPPLLLRNPSGSVAALAYGSFVAASSRILFFVIARNIVLFLCCTALRRPRPIRKGVVSTPAKLPTRAKQRIPKGQVSWQLLADKLLATFSILQYDLTKALRGSCRGRNKRGYFANGRTIIHTRIGISSLYNTNRNTYTLISADTFSISL